MRPKLKLVESPWLEQAREIIQWYVEGSDLDEEQMHLLTDCASEHCQILDNVVHMSWFQRALAENIQALDNTP